MTTEMCTFSCEAEEELRWPVSVVCQKCFKDLPTVMDTLCADACSDIKTRKFKRLCINCDKHATELLDL